MGVTIAQLGIRIDSSEAASAAVDLSHVAVAANDAEQAAGGTTTAFGKTGQAFEEFARHARAHTLSLLGASEGTRAFSGILAHLPIPLLLTVGAFAALAKAYSDGAAESAAFAKALAATGGAVGLTVGQLGALAQTVGGVVGNTTKAAEAIAALAATGLVGKENLGEFAASAVEASEKIGTTIQDIAKQFADLANDPLGASLALNKQIGQLTPTLYAQIAALLQAGKATEAARVAQKAYSDSLDGQTKQLTNYASVWERVGKAASGYWDTVKNLGRGQSALAQLTDLQAQRGSRPLGTLTPGFNTTQQLINDRAEGILQKQVDQQNAAAAATAKAAEENRNYARSIDTANLSLQLATDTSKAFYGAQIQNAQRAFSVVSANIANQTTLLEAQDHAQLLSDADYFAAKIALIQKAGAAQAAEIAKEISITKAQMAQQKALDAAQLANPNLNAADQAALRAQQLIQETADGQKLKDLQAQLGATAADTATKVKAASIEQDNALKTLNLAYTDLVISSDRYVASLQKQYDLTLKGAGLGDVARAKADQQANIAQHFQDQLDSNSDDLRNGRLGQGDAAQAQFALRNKTIEDALHKSQQDFQKYYSALESQQSDWSNGAKDAFRNYVTDAKNVAGLTNTAFTNSFKSIEDSIANFVTTGKFSFKDLANSLLAELVRIEIKVLESQVLGSVFGSLFGSAAGGLSGGSGVGELTGSTVGFAATGGNISANKPTIVGEAGPELWVPNQGGTIIPNGKLGGGGMSVVSYNNFGSGSNVAGLQAELDRRDEQIKSDVYTNLNRNRWASAIHK